MDSSRSDRQTTCTLSGWCVAAQKKPRWGGGARAYRRHRGCLSSSGLGDLGNSNNSAAL